MEYTKLARYDLLEEIVKSVCYSIPQGNVDDIKHTMNHLQDKYNVIIAKQDNWLETVQDYFVDEDNELIHDACLHSEMLTFCEGIAVVCVEEINNYLNTYKE